ncbi:hypothetical protein [Corallibacter sp.]|uniref:hypothetical protein n=1 Tax=Corallibacter sp. TaxID=2038084 RepID=UPI003AB68A55
MIRIYFKCFMFLVCASGFSQDSEKETNKETTKEKKLYVDAFSFPEGMNGEAYKGFTLSYPISSKLDAQVGGMYNKTFSSELIRSSLMLKWYTRESLHLRSGLEREYESNIFSNQQYIERNHFNLGVGYKLKPDFSLEVGYRQQINSPSQQQINFQGSKKALSVRAKF